MGRIGDWKKIEKFFRIKKEKVYSFKEKIDRWGKYFHPFDFHEIDLGINALGNCLQTDSEGNITWS